MFNPPYVPTPVEEVTQPGIARAWAGGPQGRQVIDAFLPQVLTTALHCRPMCVVHSCNSQLLACSAKVSMADRPVDAASCCRRCRVGSGLALLQVPRLLSEAGTFFLVTIAENRPQGSLRHERLLLSMHAYVRPAAPTMLTG